MKLLRMLVFAAVFPLLAGASVVTSGTITITGVIPVGAFNFGGSGFSVSGGFQSGAWQLTTTLPGVPPGTTASVDGLECCDDFEKIGNATIGGTNFVVNWAPLNPEGPSIFMITGAPITLNAGPGTYESTFTFNGALCGAQTNGNPAGDACVVNLPSLTGSGTVFVDIVQFPNGTLGYSSATYTFVVPEPGTPVLIWGGIAAFLALHRFRRSRNACHER